MKRAEYINTEYLEKHANEIINDTSVLSVKMKLGKKLKIV